jgi:phospholipase C
LLSITYRDRLRSSDKRATAASDTGGRRTQVRQACRWKLATMKRTVPLLVAAGMLASTGCSGIPGSQRLPGELPALRRPASLPGRYIKHVVIVIQENRSFDNFFEGYPGADTSLWGKTHDGRTIRLHQVSFKPLIDGHREGVDPDHMYINAVTDVDRGKMDGFDLEGNNKHVPFFAYTFVRRSQVAPYWAMARQYVLADHMFSTELGPSYTAHLQLIAGTTQFRSGDSVVDLPNPVGASCAGPAGSSTNYIGEHRHYHFNGPPPCFTFPTIADTLDQRHVSWRYYDQEGPGGELWDAFQSIQNVYFGPDWKSDVTDNSTQILTDAASGNLPGVAWVIPGYLNSDHPGNGGSDTGPSWVASVVNAIGKGPDWTSTVIVVLWDDWGGFYDNVPPPQKYYFGLGIRVPCIIISPYARQGYVDHHVYEFGSVLKLVEQVFGLPSLGTTDATSHSMLFDALRFGKPRPFVPIPAKYSERYFFTQHDPHLPIDTE